MRVSISEVDGMVPVGAVVTFGGLDVAVDWPPAVPDAAPVSVTRGDVGTGGEVEGVAASDVAGGAVGSGSEVAGADTLVEAGSGGSGLTGGLMLPGGRGAHAVTVMTASDTAASVVVNRTDDM